MTVAALTVFLGTLYPLLLDAIGGGKISVGPPYFNSTFVPLMVPLLAAMAFGPMLAWKRGDLGFVARRLRYVLAFTLVVIAAMLYLTAGRKGLAVMGVGLAVWLFGAVVAEYADRIALFRAPLGESWRRALHMPRSAYGMTIAHAGMAIVVAGITVSGAWQVERIQVVRPGETIELAGYSLKLAQVTQERGPNYMAQRAVFETLRGGKPYTTLVPEKRFYPVGNMTTTEAAIHTTWFADLYLVLGDADDKGGYAIRAYFNPLVPWIWLGALVMFGGALVSLSDRRHRVGAPRRQRAVAPGPAAPPGESAKA